MKDRFSERFQVLSMVDHNRITLREAAGLLHLSYRHIRRVYKRFQEEGEKGLVHGLKGRTSNRRITEGVRQRILQYYKKHFPDSGPTSFTEKISRLGYAISRETVRRWLIHEGLYSGKHRGRSGFNLSKSNRSFGEVIWLYIDECYRSDNELGGCSPVNLVDDATGIRLSLLSAQDIQKTALYLLRMWVEKYGIPMSICCENQFVYEKRTAVRPLPGVASSIVQTDLSRVCKTLGAEVIVFPSFELRKRLFPAAEIYHKHLRQSLSSANTHDLKQANKFLCNGFISKYNSSFEETRTALDDAHVKLRPENDVDRIFCFDTISS